MTNVSQNNPNPSPKRTRLLPIALTLTAGLALIPGALAVESGREVGHSLETNTSGTFNPRNAGGSEGDGRAGTVARKPTEGSAATTNATTAGTVSDTTTTTASGRDFGDEYGEAVVDNRGPSAIGIAAILVALAALVYVGMRMVRRNQV